MNDREKLILFMNSFFSSHDLEDDTDIFEMGYINSLFSMQLIMYLEKEYGINIGVEDMDIDNFRTIEKILQFVNNKNSCQETV